MDVHYFDREVEKKKEEKAVADNDVAVADDVVDPVVANEAAVEDDCARSILDVGRATFVPLPDRRLSDRGRAIAGGNS